MAFNKGTLPALALTAALSSNVDAKAVDIDTARLGVQEQVGKTLVHTSTEMQLEALLSQTEPVLLAGNEGVRGAIDFSTLKSLSAYKGMNETEQGKVKQMYDLLVSSAKGDKKKEEGVKHIIVNFIMFLKSISYNPESTINKSEEFLNRTITNLRKYGFGEEFVQGLESSRKVAQERDKYSMYLVSLSEKEILEKIEQMKKQILENERKTAENERKTAENERKTAENERKTAENERKTAENERKTAENRKEIEKLKQILKNLEQVRDAMSKKTA
ncbi:MAG: hypothetical protein PHI37_02860 [Candidatus Gracilibacteria bacterium]|nr:hypothetical protein [Candidatus Gracilibacteria bacterium]